MLLQPGPAHMQLAPVSSGGSMSIGAHTSAGFAAANSTTTSGITTQASGSAFLVCAVWEGDSSAPTISDSKGNSYTIVGAVQAGSLNVVAYPFWAAMFLCQSGVGGAGHTFTAAGANHYCSVFALELRGGKTSGMVDQHNSAADSATPFTSGSVTTTQDSEMAIAFFGEANNVTPTNAVGNGFTQIESITNTSVWCGALAYKVLSSISTEEASFTTGTPADTAVHVATLKAA